eukprot:1627244-Pyramimonas_sp.AAC.1
MAIDGFQPREEWKRVRSLLALGGTKPTKDTVFPLRKDPSGKVLETAQDAANDLQGHFGETELALS